MTPSAAGQWRTLAAEAVADAVRRRVVAAVAAASLLALWMIEGCTSCRATLVSDGGPVDPAGVAGAAGAAAFGVLALFAIALAGVLAADHLSQTLHDGSAALSLARPVGRATFALARLSGALAVALATGALLLGATAGLLAARHGLAPGPAVAGAAAAAAGAVATAALSMAASLILPRVACFLLVPVVVAGIALANIAALAGVTLSGVAGAVDRFGPPLATSLALALAPWAGRPPEDAALAVALRLCAWAAGAVLVLSLAFRRVEIEG